MLLVRFIFCSFILMAGLSNGLLFTNTYDIVCINQPVEYQCTVNGSGLLVLTWRVFNDDAAELGLPIVYISNVKQDPETIGGLFTVKQLSQSPLISNISFTVQSSINGYTIVCEDSNTMENKSSVVTVPDSSPGNITIHTDTFTNSSVNISWTESSSPCVTGYRYNVSSTAPGWVNIIMESTSTSVTVEGLVPSDDQYCVVVTAIEQYYTQTTEDFCYLFNVPSPIISLSVQTVSVSGSTAHLAISWQRNSSMMSDNVAVPDVIGYRVTISSDDYTDQSGLLPPNTDDHTFTGVPVGSNYTVSVVAVNGVGDSVPSLASYMLHDPQHSSIVNIPSTTIPSQFVSSTTTPPYHSSTLTSFSTFSSTVYSTTSCGLPSCSVVSPNTISDASSNVAVIVGASVAGVIVFIIVIFVILLVIALMVLKYIKSDKKGSHKLSVVARANPMGKYRRRQNETETNSREMIIELSADQKPVMVLDKRIWQAGEKGDDVVEKCLEKLQELVNRAVFPDDKGLMKRIAYIMTRNGTCPLKNIHNDGGIWQVSLHAFRDSQAVNDHSRLRGKYHAISKALGIKDWSDVMKADMEKPMYSMLAARLYLSNFPHPIPVERNIKEQRDYWWSVYMDKHEAREFMSKTSFEEAEFGASHLNHHELDLDQRIWVPGEKGDDVVDKCIDKLQSLIPGVFPDDKGLMRRIAYVMTRNGTCPWSDIRNDGGIWQVSLHAFKDTQLVNDHSRLRGKFHAISKVLGIKDWMDVRKPDMEKPMYSLLAARLYLSNFPHTIPMERDIKGQQDYWWSVYMDKHEGIQFMKESSFEEALKKS